MRKTGGAGTHNGMKSIVQELGNREFYRIKIGVGKPEDNQDLAEFILSTIKNRTLIDEGIIDSAKALEEIIINGIDMAMNKYN